MGIVGDLLYPNPGINNDRAKSLCPLKGTPPYPQPQSPSPLQRTSTISPGILFLAVYANPPGFMPLGYGRSASRPYPNGDNGGDRPYPDPGIKMTGLKAYVPSREHP